MDQASACVYRVELVLVHYNRSNTKRKKINQANLRAKGKRGGKEGRGGEEEEGMHYHLEPLPT
jgi:hypothetical protein